ncbi:MAG TPA: pyrroline-5-carboxylate reductase [Burkholderiales bacterium]
MKISFIGGGNMASAIIGGLKRQGFAASDLHVVEPFAQGRDRLTGEFGVAVSEKADAALAQAAVIVLAVKPQQMREAVAPIVPHLKSQLVVSIAAGIRLTDLSRWLSGYSRLVRCMPNTPALIGAGITALYANTTVDGAGRAAAEQVLAAVGRAVWVDDEALIDPVTAVSGSGPAYVFYFLEAMQQAGGELGLPDATTRELALETFIGAARLAAQSPETFATLRERVTSKGGTTAAALAVMNQHKIREAFIEALKAASARGKELGEEMGKG